MGYDVTSVSEEDCTDSRFKVGEIVYAAEKDVCNNSYHPEMYEIIDVEVQSFVYLNAEIGRRYIYALLSRSSTSNNLRVESENEIFGSFAGAHMHCNILNYGAKQHEN